jgi:HlyD family secretion protein
MSPGQIVDLQECSEFGQMLQARPPAIMHGTVMLSVLFLSAALAWLWSTDADLVVQASGRVRPIDDPTKIYTPADMQSLGPVAEICVKEGDRVRAGDVLLRLETALVDNQIAKLGQTVAAAKEELAGIEKLSNLLGQQRATAREKTLAQLRHANRQLETMRERRSSDIRAAESKLAALREQLARNQRLFEVKAASQQQLEDVQSRCRQAQEELAQAMLPLDEGQIEVIERELDVLQRDYEVKHQDLVRQRLLHLREAEIARKELANLQIKRSSAELRTPMDGVITSGRIDVGDVLEPGRAVFEVAATADFRFEAEVSSADVGHLRAGMPAKIRFDAYDYQRYGVATGKVTFVSPDSKMVQPDRPTGEQQVAYVVRVDLDQHRIGRNGDWGDIKLGLGGLAEIVTDRESLLTILFKNIRHTISLD